MSGWYRTMGRLRSSDAGASLIFVLVAMAILGLAVGSLVSVVGLGQSFGSPGSPGYKSPVTTAGTLDAASKSVPPGNTKDPRKSKGRCFNVAADGSSGTNYIDFSSEGQTLYRVFCTPYNANVSTSLMIQTNTQPDIMNGVALQDRAYVCGTGNYLTQGPLSAKRGVSLFSDTNCTTSLASNCPAASEATKYVTSGACPGVYVDDAVGNDGTVDASACTPTAAVWAETSKNCANSAIDLTSDLTTPAQLPTSSIANGMNLVDLASSTTSGSGAVTCSGANATLYPGIYDDTPGTATQLGADGTQVGKLLNGLGAGTAACVTQLGALSAASNNLATSLSVADRSGFIPGDSLTVNTSAFTVANSYVPATGAGALTVVPTKGTGNALSSVKVGQVPTSLSVAASSTSTLTGTTGDSSTAVDLVVGAMTLKTAFIKDATTMTLEGTGTVPSVNQYITGTGLTGSQKVTAVTTSVSASYKTTSASADVTVASGTNNATIYVGDTVSGTGIPAGATVTAIKTTTVLTLSAAATATNAVGTSLTFTSAGPKTVTFSPKANAASATAGGTIKVYAATDPTIPTDQPVSGINVVGGTLVSSTTGSTPMTGLVLSRATSSSGGATGTLTFTKSAVTGSVPGTLGTSGGVGDVLDFTGTNVATLDDSTCLVTTLSATGTAVAITSIASVSGSFDVTVTTSAAHGLAAGDVVTLSGLGGTVDALYKGIFTVSSVPTGTTFAITTVTSGNGTTYTSSSTPALGANPKATPNNATFTCNIVSSTPVSASTPTASASLVFDITSPSKSVTAVGVSAATAGQVLHLDSTGDTDLNANDCTVATGGTTFTCTLATAPTGAFVGTSGTAYVKLPLASGATVATTRSCIDVGGSWCQGPTYAALVISTIAATTGSKDITITTATDHGLTAGVSVALSGLGGSLDTLYKGTFAVKSVTSSTAFVVTTLTTGTGNTTYSKGVSPMGANPKATPSALTIKKVTMNPGDYYFTLASSWTISNSLVTIEAGLMPSDLTLNDGSVTRCVPSYSATRDGLSSDQIAAISAQGVSLIFGSYGGTDTGLKWSAGNMTVCPKPVEVDAHPTDRPTAIYGPGPNSTNAGNATGDLTGTVGAPAYYSAFVNATFSETIPGRGTCSALTGAGGAAVGSCEILYVPTSRTSDDGTALLLYGGIFAPSSRVSLVLNATNDDAVSLYGIVANSLRVITTAIATGTCPATSRTGCKNGGKVAKATNFFRFTSYPCAAQYNGAGVCTLTTAPEATWVPPGQTIKLYPNGVSTRSTAVAQTISRIAASGTTVTVTTSAAHGLIAGQQASISGVTPAGYLGPVRIASVPSTTTFTYSLASALAAPVLGTGKVTWLPDSCPPPSIYPWAGCMTVKFDPTSTNTVVPEYTVVGPLIGTLDCGVDQSACWAILN